MKALQLDDLSLSYNGRPVIDGLHWQVDSGKVYSIIGPNGCGKSTLLKAIARQLKPERGTVLLEGKQIAGFTPREQARELAMLLQSQDKVPDMTVRRLIGYGRFPHKPVWGAMRREDEAIVDWALDVTGTQPFAGRKLSALSGGERQRVWIAMALAQKPRVLLLDEPTTYLDVSHQLEIMELVTDINRLHGVTVVMVLHDINHAAAFSDEIAVMRAGALYASGTPEQTITRATLSDVFGVEARIEKDPLSGRPVCLITGRLGREKRRNVQ
ncbi:ABC transporter ATP-binding protein [Paenibacillus hodogayensis]|uniref:ABC transporter ATP-binding protein n=1 Tax=Paenibacillus hodogayensis TaxID=279208 RepID=A0ABV5VYZ3_9BACL